MDELHARAAADAVSAWVQLYCSGCFTGFPGPPDLARWRFLLCPDCGDRPYERPTSRYKRPCPS